MLTTRVNKTLDTNQCAFNPNAAESEIEKS